MAGVEPAGETSGLSSPSGRNLALRAASSLVLAPIAIAAAFFGGLVFTAFWAAAALIVLREWSTLVCESERNPVVGVGAVALAATVFMFAIGRPGVVVLLILLGALGAAAIAPAARRLWCAAGLSYSGALLIAPVLLRGDPSLGFAAILFLFAVVWLTDIVAYVIGRAVGGPKLLPRVSPNKTWSGAIGGAAAGMLGGMLVALSVDIGLAGPALIALLLSIISQAGDLAESAIKRRFNVKDAGGLIPGHGGLMDRLDGFVAAALTGLLIGLVRGGMDAPAAGLMVW